VSDDGAASWPAWTVCRASVVVACRAACVRRPRELWPLCAAEGDMRARLHLHGSRTEPAGAALSLARPAPPLRPADELAFESSGQTRRMALHFAGRRLKINEPI